MRDLYRDTIAIRDPATDTLKPLANINAYVYNAGTTSPATIYQSRVGAAQISNPILTSAEGTVEFYAEEGAYDIRYVDTIVPARVGESTRLWNAVDSTVEQGNLDAAVAALLMPVGAILPYGGATAPTGWKLCDGSAISRTDFAALFGVLSTTYGAGNGTSTFNLPDLRGRVPVGVDGAAGRLNAALHPDLLGQSGGVETIALSADESGMNGHVHSGNIPSHTHSGNAPSHTHAFSGQTGSPLEGTIGRQTGTGTVSPPSHTHAYSGSTGGPSATAFTTGGPSATGFTTGGPTGAAAASAHKNVPPYQVVNFIIKT